MYNNYGMNIANLFKRAEGYQKELKHPYVGSEHLLMAILDHDNDATIVFKKYNLTLEKFKKELIKIVGSATNNTDYVLYTPLLRKIIENATNDAIDNNNGKVCERHLILAMLDEGEGIAVRILLSLDIDLDSIYDELKINLIKANNKKLEIYEIGKSLSKTVSLEEKVIGRNNELELIIETLLRKKKSNPLLIGKAGVGKTAIVEELARRINKGLVPSNLLNKEIISIEMGSLVSGTKYRGEFEERLQKIIDEVIHNKNIILFIDEIHTIVNAGGAEGAINASDILKPYLARGDLKCIGATTQDEYYKTINKDKALDRRFLRIDIKEPSLKETVNILNGIKQEYENHHKITISDKNINDIVMLSDRYIKQKNNPDKSIDLLDMICSFKKVKSIRYEDINKLNEELNINNKKLEDSILNNNYEEAINYKIKSDKLNKKIENLQQENNNKVTKEDILEVISKNTNIPLLEDKNEILKKIKEILNNNILGEKEAINKIIKNIWIKLNNNPKVLSMLLLGPSGVGKTCTVKLIAEAMGVNLIRLDMSEYNLETSVNKLIGVSSGYVGYNDNYVLRKVLDNPYSIILIDEIEKASKEVLNLFLQILDEGFITNSCGEKIDFSNTMIFATSNIVNKPNVGFSNKLNNNVVESFQPEFLGRFTEVINFKNIDNDILIEYINNNLRNKNIDANILIKEANCEKFGFRNLRNLINKYNNEIDIEIMI